LIPLADRLGCVDGGLIELVEPAGFLWIVTVDVVLDLDFRASLPWHLPVFRDMKHQSAISAL